MTTTEKERAANRGAFPQTAEIVDEFRKFDPGVKLLWAQENGRTIGQRFDERLTATR